MKLHTAQRGYCMRDLKRTIAGPSTFLIGTLLRPKVYSITEMEPRPVGQHYPVWSVTRPGHCRAGRATRA